MRFSLSAVAAITLMLVSAHGARAQEEITVLAPGIMRGPIEQLIPGFEAKTGHKVKATYGAEDATKQQVIRGEAFDVPVLEVPYANVIASGNVLPGSETPSSQAFVCRRRRAQGRAQARHLHRRRGEAYAARREVDLFSGSVRRRGLGGYRGDALKKLGIVEQLQPKIKLTQGGARAMAMVASGEAEIGMTFVKGMTDAGIDVVGSLPREVSPPTIVVGFVSTHAKDPAAAKEFVAYLSSPEAAASFKAQQLQPGR